MFTDYRDRTNSLARVTTSSTDIEGNGATVDLNSLPVKSPVPYHLDCSQTALEFQVRGGILLRARMILAKTLKKHSESRVDKPARHPILPPLKTCSKR